MSDPEVEHAAWFLATHAVLLLGVGMLAAAMAVAVIVWATHLAARFRPAARRTVAAVTNRVQESELLRRLVGRARDWTPSAYLSLHLTLGLVMAGVVVVFATLAEEALAAGELAAFARALHDTHSPEWRRVFSVVSWFGTGEVLAIATVAVAAVLLLR
jgi:uncharacterized membrane protein